MKEVNFKGLVICLLAFLILPACQDTQPIEQEEIVKDEREACPSCGIDYFSMNPFPQSDDFPLPASTIEGWVANREGHAIRSHGWNLFAGLRTTATKRSQSR